MTEHFFVLNHLLSNQDFVLVSNLNYWLLVHFLFNAWVKFSVYFDISFLKNSNRFLITKHNLQLYVAIKILFLCMHAKCILITMGYDSVASPSPSIRIMHGDVTSRFRVFCWIFFLIGSNTCTTKCLNQETGKIRNQKSWIFFAFHCWTSTNRLISGFSFMGWWLWRNAHWPSHLVESQCWKFPSVCTTCLTMPVDTSDKSAGGIFIQGHRIINLWRLTVEHVSDSVFLTGAFRKNSSVAD